MRAPAVLPSLWAFLVATMALSTDAWSQGNQALYVDGNDSCLRIPQDPSLEPREALTLEAWVKPEGSIQHGRIIRKAGDFDDGYMLSWSFSGVRFNALVECGSYVDVSDPTAGSEHLNTWHHIAMTARAGGELRLYVDGQLVGSTSSTHCLSHTDDLYFGAAFGNKEEFIGTIDEVRFWNVERTPAQIAEYYNHSITSGTGLVSVWHLDGDGADARSANDGELQGGARFVDSDAPIEFLALSEDRGDLRGGNEILLHDDFPDFNELPTVWFGPNRASSVRIVDSATLAATVPAASELGAAVRVRVVGDGYDVQTADPYYYTPSLSGTEAIEPGERASFRFEITPPAKLLAFVGLPPSIDQPFRQYGGRVLVAPLLIDHFGDYAQQNAVELPFDIPETPGLAGVTILLQGLSGPNLDDGRSGSFSNLHSLAIQ